MTKIIARYDHVEALAYDEMDDRNRRVTDNDVIADRRHAVATLLTRVRRDVTHEQFVDSPDEWRRIVAYHAGMMLLSVTLDPHDVKFATEVVLPAATLVAQH